jgi:hypothetical protein
MAYFISNILTNMFRLFFNILLTVHLVIILANNQIDALFYVFI